MRVFDATDRQDDNVDGLIMLCKDWIKPDMHIAEIGCYRGVSTSILALYAHTVYAIDAWADNAEYKELGMDLLETAEPLFDKMMAKNNNIVKIKGMSVIIAMTFDDESLDGIYLDAAHDEKNVRADFEAWVPKVREGGVISGHDANMVHNWIPNPIYTMYSDSSWAYRK